MNQDTPLNVYPTRIKQQPFVVRWLRPVGVTLGIWLLLYIVTRHRGWIANAHLYRLLMNSGHVLLYAAYGLSALVLYPVMVFRGASLRERVLGCYITPLAYVLKEVIRVTAYFTLGESLYYALSPIVLGALVLQLGFMGLADIACRARYRQRYGEPVKLVTGVALAGIIIALASFYVLLLWDGGVHYFYFYQQGYKLLFL